MSYFRHGWAPPPQLALSLLPGPLEKPRSLHLGARPISQLHMSTALLTAPDPSLWGPPTSQASHSPVLACNSFPNALQWLPIVLRIKAGFPQELPGLSCLASVSYPSLSPLLKGHSGFFHAMLLLPQGLCMCGFSSYIGIISQSCLSLQFLAPSPHPFNTS